MFRQVRDSDDLTADGSTALDYQEVYCPRLQEPALFWLMLTENAQTALLNNARSLLLGFSTYTNIVRSCLHLMLLVEMVNNLEHDARS